MGMRSHTYIWIHGHDTEGKRRTDFIALYYRWSYGIIAVSHTASLIAEIQRGLRFYPEDLLGEEHYRLISIASIDFIERDMDSVVDLVECYQKNYDGTPFECKVAECGSLFIDVDTDDKKIQYGFAIDSQYTLVRAEEYLAPDNTDAWKKHVINPENIDVTKRNLDYIDKNAVLMSSETLQSILSQDYGIVPSSEQALENLQCILAEFPDNKQYLQNNLANLSILLGREATLSDLEAVSKRIVASTPEHVISGCLEDVK